MTVKDYQVNVENPTVTIASGQTLSPEIDLYGVSLLGLYIPASFEGTTIKIKACPNSGGTFLPHYVGGTEYSLTVGASRHVAIDNLHTIAGLRFIKLESNNAVAADRVITLSTRPLN